MNFQLDEPGNRKLNILPQVTIEIGKRHGAGLTAAISTIGVAVIATVDFSGASRRNQVIRAVSAVADDRGQHHRDCQERCQRYLIQRSPAALLPY